MTKKALIARVMALPGVHSEEDAEKVVSAVFQTLRDRITRNEADDVRAQLPTAWKELWDSGAWWEKMTAGLRQIQRLDRDEFVHHVQERIKGDVNAESAVRIVFHALKEQITPGETADVSAQLPEDLRTMWKAA